MALSQNVKTSTTVALANPSAADELIAAVDASSAKVATNVTALGGTLTGTVTGTMVNTAAAAGGCAGGAEPSAANVDTAIATAVAALVLSTNLALKELQTKQNAEIAALKVAGLQASS